MESQLNKTPSIHLLLPKKNQNKRWGHGCTSKLVAMGERCKLRESLDSQKVQKLKTGDNIIKRETRIPATATTIPQPGDGEFPL